MLPFLLTAGQRLEIALVSWPEWPGMAKGVEISILDLLALAIYLSLGRSRQKLPFRLPMFLYFFTVLLSALQAEVPVATLFYAWQLGRIFFVYVVVARACEDELVGPALMTGMAAGLYIETCLVLWQRFVIHFVQAPGTFVHQNTLGLVANLVAIPYFTLLLAGQRGWTPTTIPFADGIITVFTASRATLGLGAGGFALAFVLSVLRRATARKALVALVGVLALAAIVPLATRSLETRFKVYGLNELIYDERAILMNAGAMMLADNPNGVGANNFVQVANIKGYEDRAGVAFRKESRSALIHNIYWLAAAETGYIGVTALLFLLLQPLIVALRSGWRNRDDLRGDLLIGFAPALLIFYVHCYFEWTFFTDQVQYLFVMTLALIASTAQQLGYWRRRKAQREPPPPRRFVGRSLGGSAGRVKMTGV
jgi:O-antigen ligase